MTALRWGALFVVCVVVVASCGDTSDSAVETTSERPTASVETTTTRLEPTTSTATSTTTGESAAGCAHVIDGEVTASGDGFTVSATVLSADTGDEKYADKWEVRTVAGDVLGERILAHPHVNEQPFTRSLGDVAIPDDIDSVVLAAHDSVVGFCGDTHTVSIER